MERAKLAVCFAKEIIGERKGILKKQGRCFIRLRRAGHLARNCDSNIQCLGCQGRHHLAVCDGRGARGSDNSDSAVDGASNQPETGEQVWHNGESARLSPICPGFDSQTRRHMWIEFVVGSRSCSEGFSSGSPVFLPQQKPTFLNSNSIGNSRATGLSVEDCCVSPSLNKVCLFCFCLHLQCM